MAVLEDVKITRASREWWSRPADERYLTLEDLHRATLERKDASRTLTTWNTSLIARGSEEASGFFHLEHEELGVLEPTHWSIGQLATISHTPAKWIREIATAPAGPAFAAHAVNLGLRHLANKERVQVMRWQANGERGELRCIVGPDYGRIYDHQVVEAVMRVNADGRWHVPSASYEKKDRKRATTLYASDRDVFIFLVDEKNPVEVKINGITRYLFRGFMVWNSEVGHHKFGFMTFLYDHVCDNRTIWGAREVRELSIKHTKNAPERFEREVTPMLKAYAEASVIEVKEQLERAARKRVGSTDEEALAFLRKHDFTKKEGERIITMAKAEEGGVRTVWEIVNGGTAHARSIPHADERVRFEKRVSSLLRVA
ncbi:MAG TPA: DUF932 domain-containing protein [Thermoanaerobaculia bacterium]